MNILTTKASLLLELARQDGYGVQLIERVETRSAGQIRLTQATIYPELRSMERAGLVKSWESNPLPERGGRPRRYYSLTGKGKRAARDVVSSLEQMLTSEGQAA